MNAIIIHANGEETLENVSCYKSYGSLRQSWKTSNGEIHLYAKKKGRAGNENKYEFPPPVDSELYFGKCLLVNPTCDLTIELWHDFYEQIMKFEDIENTESEEEEMPEGEYTNGYLKDGFIVSDNELEEEPYKIDLKNT